MLIKSQLNLLLVLATLWPASVHAQSSGSLSDEQVLHVCRAMFATDALAISIGPTAIKFSFNDMNNQQITDFINSHGGKTAGAMGMTSYVPDYRFIPKRRVLPMQVGGRWCWRDEIHLELARQPVEVYISTDYRHNQCIQNAIHGHEMSHVGVFHSYLRYLAGTLQEKYGGAVGRIRVSSPRPGEQPDDQTPVMEAIRITIERALRREMEINAEVDSTQEVHRLWAEVAACEKPAAPPQKPTPAPVPRAAPARAPTPAAPAALF